MDKIKSQWGGSVIPMEIEHREKWSEPPLPPNELLCGIFGSSGQGKTMALCQLLPNVAPKFLKHIIVCSRIEGNPVYNAIEKWCEKTDKTYIFCSSIDDAMENIEKMINEKKENEHCCVIFDDFNEGAITAKTNPYAKLVNELFTKARNFNVHMIFLVQRYIDLSTVARNNLNMIIIFKMIDKYAKYALSRDFATLINKDDIENGEKMFFSLHKEISKVKHSYFMATSDNIYIFIFGEMTSIQPVEFDSN